MGSVIWVDFPNRNRIVADEYEAAAIRLQAEAKRQPQETARQLRALAGAFRERAKRARGAGH